VRLGVGVRDREHDPEARALGSRREPLAAVDHPLVAVADGAGAQRRRVRSRHLGLGHREEGAHLAGDERREEPPVLVVGAEQVEDLGVARVRGLAAEHELGPVTAADLLVEACVVEEALAGATRLRRHVRRPQPGAAGAPLEVREQDRRVVVLSIERVLLRVDVLLHEGPVGGAGLDVLGREERRRHHE
jgi:hypothetical protein